MLKGILVLALLVLLSVLFSSSVSARKSRSHASRFKEPRIARISGDRLTDQLLTSALDSRGRKSRSDLTLKTKPVPNRRRAVQLKRLLRRVHKLIRTQRARGILTLKFTRRVKKLMHRARKVSKRLRKFAVYKVLTRKMSKLVIRMVKRIKVLKARLRLRKIKSRLMAKRFIRSLAGQRMRTKLATKRLVRLLRAQRIVSSNIIKKLHLRALRSKLKNRRFARRLTKRFLRILLATRLRQKTRVRKMQVLFKRVLKVHRKGIRALRLRLAVRSLVSSFAFKKLRERKTARRLRKLFLRRLAIRALFLGKLRRIARRRAALRLSRRLALRSASRRLRGGLRRFILRTIIRSVGGRLKRVSTRFFLRRILRRVRLSRRRLSRFSISRMVRKIIKRRLILKVLKRKSSKKLRVSRLVRRAFRLFALAKERRLRRISLAIKAGKMIRLARRLSLRTKFSRLVLKAQRRLRWFVALRKLRRVRRIRSLVASLNAEDLERKWLGHRTFFLRLLRRSFRARCGLSYAASRRFARSKCRRAVTKAALVCKDKSRSCIRLRNAARSVCQRSHRAARKKLFKSCPARRLRRSPFFSLRTFLWF